MTGFSKAIRLVDVGLLLYEQRYSVHEEETVGYFHFGKKKQNRYKMKMYWNILRRIKLSAENCKKNKITKYT